MQRLWLVPFQLSLPGMGSLSVPPLTGLGEEERAKAKRDGRQWLLSIRAYLEQRAGLGWRKLHLAGERWNPIFLDYEQAARTITGILSTGLESTPVQSARDAAAQADLDIVRGAPLPLTLAEKQLSERPRAALVDELMRDPLYTERRLLEHLPKNKLARMVTQSRERRAADAALERRRA